MDKGAFGSWRAMILRCRDPKDSNYAGRGITVCDQWSRFEQFLIDMGDRPEGHSIDRIDCNGNYEPGNCRWATRQQQAANRRNKRQPGLVMKGFRISVSLWRSVKAMAAINGRTVSAELEAAIINSLEEEKTQ